MRRITAALICALLNGAVQANRIDLLYDPAPPADAAYVRVVNLGGRAVQVEGLTGRIMELGTGLRDRVGRYELVHGRDAVRLTLRSARTVASIELPLRKGRFLTVALPVSGPPIVVDETPGDFNLMKAQLAFYALAPGCRAASLSLAGDDGAKVFSGVAHAAVSRRVVNAVAAEVRVRCETPAAVASAPFTLDGIEPGRRMSVFFFGEVSAPQAAISVDQTAVPHR